MKLSTIIDAWNRFWFAPKSPVPIALFRIFIGIILLQDALLMRLADLAFYYSKNAVIPISDYIVLWWLKDPYIDLMLILPPGDVWQYAFFWFYVVMLIFLIFGLFTRFSTIAAFLCLHSMDVHFIMNQNDGDVYLRLVLMMLCLSNCGSALSLDNLLKAMRSDWRKTGFCPPVAPQWALRMLQLQVCIVYFHSYLSKITGDQWIAGMCCYYAARYEEMVRFPVPFLFDNLLCCKLLTWGTLAIELFLWTLIWVKEFRYWVLLAGLFLHAGIEWSMNLPLFEWTFMLSYIVFVYPEDLTRAMDNVKALIAKLDGAPFVVAYDGDCIICIHTVGVMHRLDIFGRFCFVNFRDPAELSCYLTDSPNFNYDRAEMRMQLYDRKVWLEGFAAFRFMTKRLPLLLCLVPILYLPFVSFLGEKIYDFVAKRRYLFLGGTCQTEACLAHGSGLKV